ncbi:MAG: SURF1 family protein [Gammaproteobacteria bacterium]|uniref:SURF1 family protein n=1 Tax=Pseudomaricurvus alcaniphilus TaxID=1166482 RepID=UPI00140DE49F|nr:SURF1 family protein [Pseudomaricurvus alcaniphilus]MBR9912616.1 SURF1 family protein [Gammaproteobacteria bacterium]NHN38799.1 SURF1 family protein [Pseudomaricurvus alcaniphilus]
MPASLTLSFNWKITLLGLLFLPLLAWLGFWQLERAAEKSALLAAIAAQQALPPVQLDLRAGSGELSGYRRVRAVGTFLQERTWLVDNRVLQGRVGYEVIMPLQLESGGVVLVNRGWVAAPPLRSELPTVATPAGRVIIEGRLQQPEGNTLVRDLESSKAWPKRIQQLDVQAAGRQLQAALLPWVLQLGADDEHALAVVWRDVNTSPDKHTGYAVQWFAMAVALLIALLFANIKRATAVPTPKDRQE